MLLHYSPASPYARKVRMCIHQLGLEEQVKTVVTNPWDTPDFHAVNPLGKIPALVRDDGRVLYDSPVICEYLAFLAGDEQLFPALGDERWEALRLQALADGMADAAVRWVVDGRLPEDEQSPTMLRRQQQALTASLVLLEQMNLPVQPVTIGDWAVVAAVGYIHFRQVCMGWEEAYPSLAEWWERVQQHPAVVATDPA